MIKNYINSLPNSEIEINSVLSLQHTTQQDYVPQMESIYSMPLLAPVFILYARDTDKLPVIDKASEMSVDEISWHFLTF